MSANPTTLLAGSQQTGQEQMAPDENQVQTAQLTAYACQTKVQAADNTAYAGWKA